MFEGSRILRAGSRIEINDAKTLFNGDIGGFVVILDRGGQGLDSRDAPARQF